MAGGWESGVAGVRSQESGVQEVRSCGSQALQEAQEASSMRKSGELRQYPPFLHVSWFFLLFN